MSPGGESECRGEPWRDPITVFQKPGMGKLYALTFNSDGSMIGATDGAIVAICNITDRSCRVHNREGIGYGFTFSPNKVGYVDSLKDLYSFLCYRRISDGKYEVENYFVAGPFYATPLSIAYSPDGHWIAGGNSDGHIHAARVFSSPLKSVPDKHPPLLKRGEKHVNETGIKIRPDDGSVNGLVFIDDSRLVSAGHNRINCTDIATGEILWSIETLMAGHPKSFAFAACNGLLACHFGDELCIWRVDPEVCDKIPAIVARVKHSGSYANRGVAFSEDGLTLAVLTSQWEVSVCSTADVGISRKIKRKSTFTFKHPVHGVALSANGSSMALALESKILLYERT